MTGRTKPAAGTRVIDLDRARAARAEDHGEPVTVRFGGRDFTLPPELPFEFAEHLRGVRLRDALAVLFGDQAPAFFDLRPSLDDVRSMSDAVAEMYGLTSGESPASSTS